MNSKRSADAFRCPCRLCLLRLSLASSLERIILRALHPSWKVSLWLVAQRPPSSMYLLPPPRSIPSPMMVRFWITVCVATWNSLMCSSDIPHDRMLLFTAVWVCGLGRAPPLLWSAAPAAVNPPAFNSYNASMILSSVAFCSTIWISVNTIYNGYALIWRWLVKSRFCF